MKCCFLSVVLIFDILGIYSRTSADDLMDGFGIIQGIVDDSSRSIPIEGAYVYAFLPSGSEIDSVYDRTDALGRYTLAIPLNDENEITVDVLARKDRYNSIDTSGIVVSFQELVLLDIHMSREYGPIWGYVRDSAGRGIEDVHVFVVDDTTKSATTNQSGVYGLTVRDSSENGYDLRFSHGDFEDRDSTGIIVGLGTLQVDMILERINWYVSENGSPNWWGSRTYPFDRIQKGVDAAGDDDTVFVMSGIMRGEGNRGVFLNFKKIVVKALGDGESPSVIDCERQGNGFLIEHDRGSSLMGMTIINGETSGPGGGIHCRAGQAILTSIDGCKLYNNYSATQGGGISIQTVNTLVKISNCEIKSNSAREKGGGLYIYETYGVIEGCVITDNFVEDGVGAGIMFHDYYSIGDSLINCTISGSSGHAAVYVKNSHPLIKNSILWGDYPSEIDTFYNPGNPGSSVPVVEYCDVEGGWVGNGNIDWNPFFCDSYADDFHLAENSLCLTAGEGGTFMGAFPEFGCLAAGVIYGTVVDSVSRGPLENVNIAVTSSQGTVRNGITSAQGAYEIVIPNAIENDNAHIQFRIFTHLPLDVDTVFDVGYSTRVDTSMVNTTCGIYIVGDYNGVGGFNIADVVAAFAKLNTGSPDAFLICECPPGSGDFWEVAMDVNNSCNFNLADVIIAFSLLSTGQGVLIPCDQCPPP